MRRNALSGLLSTQHGRPDERSAIRQQKLTTIAENTQQHQEQVDKVQIQR
jgi:hypothetical protein